ncbi:peptide/nickel transport system permease protein [Nitrospirillum amazonense]|uniref:Peptide/nickel transport system permease protein n=1 Tax=Nitrospirillum amazonense TaxID=28077 RepID=A0A560FT89_9PROT|nr:ABC transporter permease [Nitrospirillum amazonense]TWB24858.1 peptide/nickel transport system permease protein [Nitrospirillum amazonense]
MTVMITLEATADGSRHSKALAAGLFLTGLVVATALLSLAWTPYDPTAINVAGRMAAPSATHWFGTDAYGRDVFSHVLAGGRSALGVALAAVGVGAGFGVPLGLLAAGRRGWVEEVAMRGSDVVFAFPALITAVLIAALCGPGAVDAIAAIGLFNIPVFAKVARGAALGVWARDYTLAARLAGKGGGRISAEHVLPNIAGLLLVQAAIQLSLGIVADAGLSFVGLGTQAPQPSWGRMLADSQTLAGQAPWLVLFPGLAVVAAVLGFNLLGEGLRGRLAPKRGA